jgi:hypothetical protein
MPTYCEPEEYFFDLGFGLKKRRQNGLHNFILETNMNHFTNLNRVEADGIKRAMIQLIDERDLQAAISLLEASIDFSKAERGDMREMMFKSLFDVASAKAVASPI